MGLKSNPAARPRVGKAWLVGREHLRLAGPFPAAHYPVVLLQTDLTFNTLKPRPNTTRRTPYHVHPEQEAQVRSQVETGLKITPARGWSSPVMVIQLLSLGRCLVLQGRSPCGFYIQIFTSHRSPIAAVGCLFRQLLLKLLFDRRTKDK